MIITNIMRHNAYNIISLHPIFHGDKPIRDQNRWISDTENSDCIFFTSGFDEYNSQLNEIIKNPVAITQQTLDTNWVNIEKTVQQQ
ncbi:hypothetical protein KSX29_00925 [Photobacterium ganghwense]|nr:hypothetical protein [Photobacterium ganghwense]